MHPEELHCFFLFSSFMNANCTDPGIANPIPNPCFVTFTHPPVAALCFILGKTGENGYHCLAEKRGTQAYCLFWWCRFGFSWFSVSVKWRSSPRCLPWLLPATESRVTALLNASFPRLGWPLYVEHGPAGNVYSSSVWSKTRSPKEGGGGGVKGREKEEERNMREQEIQEGAEWLELPCINLNCCLQNTTISPSLPFRPLCLVWGLLFGWFLSSWCGFPKCWQYRGIWTDAMRVEESKWRT